MRNIFFLLLLIVFNSCINSSKIEKIGVFVFPDNVWMIEGDIINRFESDDIKYPSLCFWLDSTKCTPCDYDMLYNFDTHYKKNGELSFYVIVTPPVKYKNRIDHEIRVNDFPFPVILDTVDSFYSSNKQVDIREKEYVYIFLDERGEGHKYVLPGERMEYDICGIIDYCIANHR